MRKYSTRRESHHTQQMEEVVHKEFEKKRKEKTNLGESTKSMCLK